MTEYRVVFRVGYGPPGYKDVDYEYSSWYDNLEDAKTLGKLEVDKVYYKRDYTRSEGYSIEVKDQDGKTCTLDY